MVELGRIEDEGQKRHIKKIFEVGILLSALETDTLATSSNFISSLKAFFGANVADWVAGLYALIPLVLWGNTNALCII